MIAKKSRIKFFYSTEKPQIYVSFSLPSYYTWSFSFLGIGVQPNVSEWGMMLNDAKPYFRRIPGLMLYPGMAIFITVLAFNLLGETFEKKGIKRIWKK